MWGHKYVFSSVRSTSSENADYSLEIEEEGTKVPKIFKEFTLGSEIYD